MWCVLFPQSIFPQHNQKFNDSCYLAFLPDKIISNNSSAFTVGFHNYAKDKFAFYYFWVDEISNSETLESIQSTYSSPRICGFVPKFGTDEVEKRGIRMHWKAE